LIHLNITFSYCAPHQKCLTHNQKRVKLIHVAAHKPLDDSASPVYCNADLSQRVDSSISTAASPTKRSTSGELHVCIP
jgi:hypothetical protein